MDEALEEENELLKKVPAAGRAIGNKALRKLLGWDDTHYFGVRQRLIEQGAIAVGRGQGGSVSRVPPIAGLGDNGESEEAIYEKESHLYAPVEKALKEYWHGILGHTNYLVKQTAMSGKKATGGMWTRPDLTVVYLQ